MIHENLKVADTVSDEFVNEVLLLSMEEFMDFGKAYRVVNQVVHYVLLTSN